MSDDEEVSIHLEQFVEDDELPQRPTLRQLHMQLKQVATPYQIPLLCVTAAHGNVVCSIGADGYTSPAFYCLALHVFREGKRYLPFAENNDDAEEVSRAAALMAVLRHPNALTPLVANRPFPVDDDVYSQMEQLALATFPSCPEQDALFVAFQGTDGHIKAYTYGHNVKSPYFQLINALLSVPFSLGLLRLPEADPRALAMYELAKDWRPPGAQ